ncbi:MAG: hypothetical protein J6R04_04885 [Clostridia bacterium]|nr:hypothetical protein [Clostridia bacterium]
MKRIISMTLVMLLVLGSLCMFACKANEDEIPENAIYVTISDGSLALVRRAVSLSDADGDGATTIGDALVLAHDAAYEGGAAAGFGAAETEYGLSMTKLWGITSGAYGYCVNDASAMSLYDAVAVGDHVYAYVYRDLETWSDVYSYFDRSAVETAKGEQVTLTLTYVGYDAAWNLVTAPVADAVITVNGEATSYTTDAEGKVTLSFDKKGSYTLSATSETLTLVPPVCVVAVK